MSLILQYAGTFIFAIQDLSEFLQRLFESAFSATCAVDFLFYIFKLEEIIELFDVQERVYTVTNKRIHRKYLVQEYREVIMYFVTTGLVMVGLLIETVLPVSGRTLNLMSTVYRRKYPSRILPFNVWTPSFIDASEKEYFITFYLLDVYLIILILTMVFGRMMLQTMFPTSLLGQYKMLAEFIKLIGVDHKDKSGETIFYTDIARGRYFTETDIIENHRSEISKQDMILELRKWAKKDYPIFYVRQIIKRQQELEDLTSKYMRYAVSYYSSIFLPLLTIWLLAFYQMVYVKTVPQYNFIKFVAEFLFTVVSYLHLTIQSERLDDCNGSIQMAINQSRWYNSSPAVRRELYVLFNSVRKSRQLSLLGNCVEFTKPGILRYVKMAFSFINFLQIEGRL
ncbi:hypothetical protein M8J77_016438 [Diaphorina citri]|nr:hypothetical protein M8J77_016438 [Diaphorina citri]